MRTGHRRREAGPGGRARAAPRQPPARLPGVRQGRRVPAAGPGVQPRSRREPLRRGEAPLREADPDQRPRPARPRALHPVRPLHPLRRRGRRRPADPLHPPRQRHPGADVPRRAVRVVLLRQHRADLPGRRAHGHAVPVQGPAVGPRAGREHVHDVLGRLPGRGPVEPRPARCATRASTPTRSTGAGCATGAGSTSRRSTPTERLAAPLVRGESGLVETSWSGAIGDRRGARPRGARRRRAGRDRPARRRPRHERGCVRVGQARRRARHRRPRRPARRRAAGRACSDSDRATIDEAANASTIVLLGPDLKEELPVLYLRLRDAAEKRRSRILEISPTEIGPHATWRGRASATSPVEQPASSARPSPSRRSASSSAKGNVVVVAGRANLAESQASAVASLAALLAAVPRRQGAARAPARQRRRRPRARAPPARRR